MKLSKICGCCKEIFFKRYTESNFLWENRNHCSTKCSKLKLPIKEYKQQKLEYILSKTITTESGCIEWTGYLLSNRYGQSMFLGKKEGVHRIIWRILKEEIPEGLCVLHSCDNHSCININHLFLGTNKDNSDDMVQKGRQAKGFRNGMSRLSENELKVLFQMAKDGCFHYDIGKKFNMSVKHISRLLIKNGIRRMPIKS